MQDGKPPINQAVTLEDLDRAPEFIPPSPGDIEAAPKAYADSFAVVSNEKDGLQERVEAETTRALNVLIVPSAKKAFIFMWVYCGGVLLLLSLDGFSFHGFHLPDSTLNLLVGSTAVTVIGLVGMVLTGIFVGARKW